MFVPTSKGSLALVLVIGLMMGVMGVAQGHAGNAEIDKSDLDLPDRDELTNDETALPDVGSDAYSRFVENMLHGMTAYGMWMYSTGHAIGESVQWLPRLLVVGGAQALTFTSIVGMLGWQIMRARRHARDTR